MAERPMSPALYALGAVGLLAAAGSASARTKGSRARPVFMGRLDPEERAFIQRNAGDDAHEAAERILRRRRIDWMGSVFESRPELFERCYFVSWENGNDWDVFRMPFETEEAATAFGDDWKLEMDRDFEVDHPEEYDEDGSPYDFEVIERYTLRRTAMAPSLSGRKVEIDPWEGITDDELDLWNDFLIGQMEYRR